jgi:LPS export ABC transporter protein LptC
MNFKQMSKKQKIYAGAFLAVAGVLVWAFVSAGIITRNFNRQQLVGTENHQELDVSGIILTETKAGKKYWEIYGETGNYNSESKIALLDNVTSNFYSNNNVSMSVEATTATYNEVKKQIILFNNIHIVIKDGTQLYCDRLTWSGSDKDVIADGNVRINRNNELVAVAQKAIISPDYAKFKITGKTVTKLYQMKEK